MIMKYAFYIVGIILLMSCQKKLDFIEIPYKTTSPFFAMDLLNSPLHEYVKKNGIKSIGVRHGNKNVEDHYVFDKNGLLVSNRIYPVIKAEYTYDDEKLIRINNPGNIYSIEDAEYIKFEYDNEGRVIHATTSIPKSRSNTEVGFFYHKDSTEIISYDSIPKYWLEKTVFIKNSSGQIVKEKQYRFKELWCYIDYVYDKANILNAKVWYMNGEKVQTDSIKNGLEILSITDLDTCRYEYLPNEIRSCWKGNLYIQKW